MDDKEFWARLFYELTVCLDGPPDEPYEKLPEETKAFYEKLAEHVAQEEEE